MSRPVAIAVAIGALGACTTAQSARVLAPGQTQISVAANRVSVTDEDGVIWYGQVMVRRGLAPKVDAGLILTRTPGGSGGVSMLAAEPKLQLTAHGAKTTFSLGLAAGALWSDQSTRDGLEGDVTGFLVSPTAYLGFELSPGAELVAAPRLYLIIPDEGGDNQTAFGATVGVRFTDAARSWAIHPEFTYLAVEDADETFLTLGVSVSAGD